MNWMGLKKNSQGEEIPRKDEEQEGSGRCLHGGEMSRRTKGARDKNYREGCREAEQFLGTERGKKGAPMEKG